MRHMGDTVACSIDQSFVDRMIWVEDFADDDAINEKTIWRYALREDCYVKSDRQHIPSHLLTDKDFRPLTTRLYLQKENNRKLHGKFVSNYELTDRYTRANLHNFTSEL